MPGRIYAYGGRRAVYVASRRAAAVRGTLLRLRLNVLFGHGNVRISLGGQAGNRDDADAVIPNVGVLAESLHHGKE